MTTTNTKNEFLYKLKLFITEKELVKVILGKPQNTFDNIKKVVIRMVEIKNESMLSFVYRYKTKDITKNCNIDDGIDRINSLLGQEFLSGHMFSVNHDIELEYSKACIPRIHYGKPTHIITPSLAHNKEKKRFINTDNNIYLRRLGVLTKDGKIAQAMEGKYKQINKFIEIFHGLLFASNLSNKKTLNILDMGSGKGYLTFALYDYLKNGLNLDVYITGVELNEDLVKTCNSISKEIEFNNLKFVSGQIKDYVINNVDILIALHACDTATDDAIYQGVVSNATVIVCAPCCHKQIRKQMKKQTPGIAEILNYGILKERQAEIVTDTIRALLLEYCGYKTNVFEFISTEHTSKNLMITGIKKTKQNKGNTIIIADLKKHFGINSHYLEKLLLGQESRSM